MSRLAGGFDNLYANDTSTVVTPYDGYVGYLYPYETSTVTVSGASVVYLHTYDTSTVAVSGASVRDLSAYGTSTVAVSGASVDYVDTYGTSSVDISGGRVDYVYTNETSTVDISGGSFYVLGAQDSSTVTLHGYDFQPTDGLSLDGNKVVGTGVLIGKWYDGTQWSISISVHDAGASILAIPEPAALALLALGGLAVLRRPGK